MHTTAVAYEPETFPVVARSSHTWESRRGEATYLLDHSSVDCPMHADGTAVEDLEGLTWACPVCYLDGDVRPVDTRLAGPSVDARTHGTGTGGGRSEVADEPTEAQERFFRSLLTEAGADPDPVVDALKAEGAWTKRTVSKAIDALKAAQAARPEQAAPVRRNRFGGPCERCGGHVDAEAGILSKAGGRWVVQHEGPCPASGFATESEAPAPVEQVTEGMYAHPTDGRVWKVQPAKGSGRLYAKLLRLVGDSGEWDYDRGAMRVIRPEWRMDLDAAKAFGRATGCCCNCGRTLTNPESIEAGIGPICATRF